MYTIDYNVALSKNVLIPVVLLFSLLIIGSVNADESDIDISSIRYTNDFVNGEAVTIVSSGKDGGTEYKYNLYDDDDDDCDTQSCLPENWYATDFDDSSWSSGAAPFGNEEINGVTPGTIWETESGLDDYIVIRHYFNYTKEENILSATLNVAHNNYYMAYLNGNLIRDCSWYQNHDGCYEGDPEYWNNRLTYDGGYQSGPNPDWLVDGENVLVILGIDITWGGDTEQWLDVELSVNVQSWNDPIIVLGDELVLRIDYYNSGDSNETNINVTLEIEQALYSNKTINIESNQTYEWQVYWKPSGLGDFNITAKVGEKYLTKTIHVGYYAYSLNFSNKYKTTNIDESTHFEFTLKNEGDVNDNFTFYLNGIPNDWDYSFTPQKADLSPGESITILLNITCSDDAAAGDYALGPIIRSQYYDQSVNTILQSGASAATEYRYEIWNASEFPNEFYLDDFDTTNWTNGAAPFGNDELNGVDPNTLWQTDDSNETHIAARHYFNYTGDLNFSQLRLKVAHDDYFRAYLNGELIRDCFSGWGCSGNGNYWEEIETINNSWLKNGENLLAIAARDSLGYGGSGGDGRQWLDMELETLDLRSSLWDFEEIYEELTLKVNETYDFEILVPISEKHIEDDEYVFAVWVINRGNVKDTYDVTVSLNDTEAFSIINYNEVLEIPYSQDRDVEFRIGLTDAINEFSIGEITITINSRNSTTVLSDETVLLARLYIIPDILPPGTYAESEPLVNNSSFEVSWFVEDWYSTDEIMGNDTKYFIIEYITDSGTNGETWTQWTMWQNFTADQRSEIFTDAMDGYRYRFRSIGGDNEGLLENKENKYDTQTIVDTSAPYATVSLRIEGNITNLDYIEIEWSATHPNITGYRIEYRLNEQNWTEIEDYTMAKWIGFNIPIDGDYEFRVITSDEAGNEGISDLTEKITVDTSKPATNIVKLDKLTAAEQIEIDLENQGDTVNVTLYYYFARENEEIMPIVWDKYGDYLTTDFPVFVSVENEFHYYFRITAYDRAGNQLVNESYDDVIVDRDVPQKIRNLEITDKGPINNGTTDIVLTFMSSQSQDLSSYRIYRSTSENETGSEIDNIITENLYITYTDSNVEIGYTYYYSVMAVDRMNFESEPETGFIVLEVEKETTVEEENEEGSGNIALIGAGIVGLVSLAGAGYYLTNANRVTGLEEEITGIAEVVETHDSSEVSTTESKFTEVDGEFLCSACGSMFEMTDEKTCPSCGTMDD